MAAAALMAVLDYQQTYELAINAGATPEEARILAALPGPESGYDTAKVNAKNKNGSIDRGLFQINSVHGYDPDQLLNDPEYNARAAVEVLRKQGFDAWTDYRNGSYKDYLSDPEPTTGTSAAPSATATATAPTDTLESRLLSINSALSGHFGSTMIPPSQARPAQPAAQQATPSSPAAPSTEVQTVIDAAKSALGQPYVWGGNDLSKGVDCSGLIQQAFKAAGIDLPRVSNDQARAGEQVPVDQMQPGDILWWDYGAGSQVDGADHVALYLGDGKMIEALHRGAPVHIVDVRPPSGVTRVTTSAPQGSYDPNAKQVEVGPDDTLGSRLAAINAAISSTTSKVSGF